MFSMLCFCMQIAATRHCDKVHPIITPRESQRQIRESYGHDGARRWRSNMHLFHAAPPTSAGPGLRHEAWNTDPFPTPIETMTGEEALSWVTSRRRTTYTPLTNGGPNNEAKTRTGLMPRGCVDNALGSAGRCKGEPVMETVGGRAAILLTDTATPPDNATSRVNAPARPDPESVADILAERTA